MITQATYKHNNDTSGLKRYFEIIRLLSNLWEVTILRDAFNVSLGIIIVGHTPLVFEFMNTLVSIIHKIENETRYAPVNALDTQIHLSEQKANIKAKACKLYLALFEQLVEEKKQKMDRQFWEENRRKRKEYIRESNLRTKKTFKYPK